MKFIFADSMDVVDPNYDFINDKNSPNRQPYWDDVYPHELYSKPPYEGILISKAIVGGSKISGKYTESQKMRFLRIGAKDFLRVEKKSQNSFPVFGDCGAFSYSKFELPPYTPTEMIDFYGDGQFDYGCSIDHIIFEYFKCDLLHKDPSTSSKERFDITLQLASEFINQANVLGPNFTPIGVIQGWDIESIETATRKLISMGYTYLAIGGLVPLKTPEVHEIVATVNNIANEYKYIRIHLLGFAKADYLHEFTKYKSIASFDTTSPLLKAFKDNTKNYWISNAENKIEYYSAIRVPQVLENNRFLAKIKRGELSLEKLKQQEKNALNNLREFDKDSKNIEETLDSVIEYSKPIYENSSMDGNALTRKLEQLRTRYQKTLEDQPWKKCNCKICKEISIEVMIFRASNRNKRRGFHNIYVYYNHVARLQNK